MPNNPEIYSIVLAAGYGTRLKELGADKPKGLFAYHDTNLITHMVQELHRSGIKEIAVVTNAKFYDQYLNWSKNLPFEVTLLNDHCTLENRPGALGDLLFTINEMGWIKNDLLVAPSDTYFAFSLSLFLRKIAKHPTEFATVVRKMKPEEIRNRLGCAELDQSNHIIRFEEKPANPFSPYASVPIYAGQFDFINRYADEGNSMDAPGNMIPWLIKNHYPVYAFIATGRTIDVGTPQNLDELKRL